jgi:hypothetical protein
MLALLRAPEGTREPSGSLKDGRSRGGRGLTTFPIDFQPATARLLRSMWLYRRYCFPYMPNCEEGMYSPDTTHQYSTTRSLHFSWRPFAPPLRLSPPKGLCSSDRTPPPLFALLSGNASVNPNSSRTGGSQGNPGSALLPDKGSASLPNPPPPPAPRVDRGAPASFAGMFLRLSGLWYIGDSAAAAVWLEDSVSRSLCQGKAKKRS